MLRVALKSITFLLFILGSTSAFSAPAIGLSAQEQKMEIYGAHQKLFNAQLTKMLPQNRGSKIVEIFEAYINKDSVSPDYVVDLIYDAENHKVLPEFQGAYDKYVSLDEQENGLLPEQSKRLAEFDRALNWKVGVVTKTDLQ
jgi:hypothetical protein